MLKTSHFWCKMGNADEFCRQDRTNTRRVVLGKKREWSRLGSQENYLELIPTMETICEGFSPPRNSPALSTPIKFFKKQRTDQATAQGIAAVQYDKDIQGTGIKRWYKTGVDELTSEGIVEHRNQTTHPQKLCCNGELPLEPQPVTIESLNSNAKFFDHHQ